jgi:hypothetical protein
METKKILLSMLRTYSSMAIMTIGFIIITSSSWAKSEGIANAIIGGALIVVGYLWGKSKLKVGNEKNKGE